MDKGLYGCKREVQIYIQKHSKTGKNTLCWERGGVVSQPGGLYPCRGGVVKISLHRGGSPDALF